MSKNFETIRLVFQDTRVKQLLIFGGVSIGLIAGFLVWAQYSVSRIGIYFIDYLFGSKYSAGLWTLISAVIFSPVAFILWYFRDQNQQLQIENHRKDINLKDFQKLCEWASGLHLVEEKVTVNQKTNAQGSEKTETIEQSRPPVNSSADTTSRRDGSIGLQIAAVYQLRAFIEGDHGEHFIKPALLLILALWEGLMNKHQQAYFELKQQEIYKPVTNEFWEDLKMNIFSSSKSLLAQSLSEMLFIDNGSKVAQQKRILANKNIVGLAPYSLHSVMLDWSNVDFTSSNFLLFKLAKAKLTDCIFINTNFIHSDFEGSLFVNCKFYSSTLEWCNFIYHHFANATVFKNCKIRFSIIKNTTLHRVAFRNCIFYVGCMSNTRFNECVFENGNLNLFEIKSGLSFEKSGFYNLEFQIATRAANFSGCIFEGVDLSNTCIINGLFDDFTNFKNCTVSFNTKIEVRWKILNESDDDLLLKLETHALRLRLREKNGLVLDRFEYKVYAEYWNELSEAQQKDYYDNAYKNANQDDID